MLTGGGSHPYFKVRSWRDPSLDRVGGTPWTYFAETFLEFLAPGARPSASSRLLFRLDTGAFVSAIPQRWLHSRSPPGLERFLGPLSATLSISTVAGTGAGRLARGVPVRFAGTAETYRFDFLVTPGLDGRDYGLIALRDVVRHFAVGTEGGLRIGPAGEPVELPVLALYPQGGRQQVRWVCPRCRAESRGRAGLHLVCGDCNQRMVTVSTPSA